MGHLDREIVWLGHDNHIKLILKSCGSAVDLSGTTAMTLNFGGQTLTSTNGTDQCMTWNQAGYDTGEAHIHIGSFTSLTAGHFDAVIVVYDPTNASGVVWGDIVPLVIKPEVETP